MTDKYGWTKVYDHVPELTEYGNFSVYCFVVRQLGEWHMILGDAYFDGKNWWQEGPEEVVLIPFVVYWQLMPARPRLPEGIEL